MVCATDSWDTVRSTTIMPNRCSRRAPTRYNYGTRTSVFILLGWRLRSFVDRGVGLRRSPTSRSAAQQKPSKLCDSTRARPAFSPVLVQTARLRFTIFGRARQNAGSSCRFVSTKLVGAYLTPCQDASQCAGMVPNVPDINPAGIRRPQSVHIRHSLPGFTVADVQRPCRGGDDL